MYILKLHFGIIKLISYHDFFHIFFSSPNGDTLKNINTSSNTAAASASPFLMPGGHPFPLAAAAAAAAAAGIPVSLPTPTSAVITKDKQDLPVPSYPFPFFR